MVRIVDCKEKYKDLELKKQIKAVIKEESDV
jgi:hypothetical protein